MLRLTMDMDTGMVAMDTGMDMVAMDTMDIMDMVMANRMLNVQELSTEENVKLDKPSHKLLLSNFIIVESKKCKRINLI